MANYNGKFHESSFDRRKREAKERFDNSSELQNIVKANEQYFDEIETYDFDDLMNALQPLWTNQHFNTEHDAIKLTLLILQYQLRGFDMEYFMSGGGSNIRTTRKLSDGICIVL